MAIWDWLRRSGVSSALNDVSDAQLRAGIVELFDQARAQARAGETDLIILSARRLACLYQLLVKSGYPPITDCLVVSDRFLDVAQPWHWSKVLILDDSVVVGTTLFRLHESLCKRVPAGGSVRCAAVCVDVDQSVQFLLDPIHFEPLYSRSRDEVDRFSTDIVTALFRNGIPYFSDFPCTIPMRVTKSSWTKFLEQPAWHVADVTAPIIGDDSRHALAQIPTAISRDAVLSRLLPTVGAFVDTFKVRSYLTPADSDEWLVTLVPIVMIAPSTATQLDNALRAIVESADQLQLKDFRWELLDAPAKHRLVQMYASFVLLGTVLGSEEAPFGECSSRQLDSLQLALYFGDKSSVALQLFDAVMSTLNATPAGTYRPKQLGGANVPSDSPLLSHEGLQELLWELREFLAETDLPPAPGPGELTKIGLLFAHAITSVFGFISKEIEEPQRHQIRSLKTLEEYDAVFGQDSTERILNQGLTLRELTLALAPACLSGPEWSRSIVSLGIDIGNDLGIIVPVTQEDTVRGLVYRAYRLGETAQISENPLPRAARFGDWDALARAARSGYPIFSEHRDIDWLLTPSERKRSEDPGSTGEGRLVQLRHEVSTAVPGTVVRRFQGTVQAINDQSFTAELFSYPDRSPAQATLPLSQIGASQLPRLRRGVDVVWTVFEFPRKTATDRISRVRLLERPELDLEEMDRAADRFAYLANPD